MLASKAIDIGYPRYSRDGRWIAAEYEFNETKGNIFVAELR